MSVPNFSFLACLEVAEKFVWGWGWNTWLLCLTSTLVTLSWVESSWGRVGFWQKSMKTAVRSFSLISPTSSLREGKDNIEHPHQEGADVPNDVPWGGEHDVQLISAEHIQVKPHSHHYWRGYLHTGCLRKIGAAGDGSEQAYDDLFNVIKNDQVDPMIYWPFKE